MIALTSSYVGRSSDGSFLFEDKRKNDLLGLHINFAKQWPQTYYFVDLEKRYHVKKQVPMFKYGILFTGAFKNYANKLMYPAHTKGTLLAHFLRTIQWIPSHVIMIDNKRGNLESVENMLKNSSTPFDGFWYGKIYFS